ncbi:MAG: ribosome maturation factor RimP [Aquificae bacterium]|nr:ribosome maturation factor RimP [Aquificota bacterium]
MEIDREGIEKKIKELVEPIVKGMGFRLFDVEFKPEARGWVVRIIADKEGGITIRDCEDISRKVSALLDVEDLIPFSYLLEITSPGLTRPLTKPEHYDFFRGRLAKLILKEPIEGKREVVGYIEDVRNGIIDIRDKEKGSVLHIPFSAIAKGRLEIEGW